MDKNKLAQNGFDLLMLLAISDRNYHSKEANKIHEFITRHYHIHDFDVRTLEYYKNLNEEDRLNKIVHCAEIFSKEDNNKNIMIDFVIGVVFADRKFADEEKIRFKILEKFWNFNLEEYLEKEKLNKN